MLFRSQKLIDEALLENKSDHPFGNSATYMGLGETDLMQSLHERLSKRFIDSYVSDVFQECRVDILSRKISTSLKDVHTISKNCNKCSIPTVAELPKWNVDNPDIVVVIESPSISPEAISLMVDSFKKADLSSQQLCLTYVNRCPVNRKYENKEIINCSPFLHSEIQLLNPKLILCMGTLPSTVLFGTDMKLKDTRGEIMWLGYWPILTTYSPQYVIKSSSFDSDSVSDHFINDLHTAKKFITKPLVKKIYE